MHKSLRALKQMSLNDLTRALTNVNCVLIPGTIKPSCYSIFFKVSSSGFTFNTKNPSPIASLTVFSSAVWITVETEAIDCVFNAFCPLQKLFHCQLNHVKWLAHLSVQYTSHALLCITAATVDFPPSYMDPFSSFRLICFELPSPFSLNARFDCQTSDN